MHYDIDEVTHAPTVVVSVRGDTNRETLVVLLDQLLAVFRSWSEPGTVVFDVCDVAGFDANQRRVLATWRAQNQKFLEASIRRVAYVMTSRLVRGYLTAVNWLRPHGIPQRVFPELQLAIDWLAEDSSERG